MKKNDELRERVVDLLRGGGAHASPKDVLSEFPVKLRGKSVPSAPHTPWEMLEHMRSAQWDLLEYSRTPGFESPRWPEGYWPKTTTPPGARAWSKSVRRFLADQRALIKLARDGKHDLLAPLAHAPDTNLLLELFLVASHNSYHLGQLMLLRRMCEARSAGKRR